MPDTKSKKDKNSSSPDAPPLTPDQFMQTTGAGQVTSGPSTLTPDQFMTTVEDDTTKSKPKSKADTGTTSATDDIKAIMAGRKFEDLSQSEKFNVLSLGFREYARRAGARAHKDRDVLNQIKDVLGTYGGTLGEVSTSVVGAATEPKNIAIGAAGAVSKLIPGGYFLIEGAARLPGEVQKVIKNPTDENVLSFGMTFLQVFGAGGEMAEERIAKAGAPKAVKQPGALQKFGQRMVGTGPRLAEKLVRDEERAFAASPDKAAEVRSKAAESIRTKNDEYNAKIDKIGTDYAHNVAAREKAIAEAKAKYEQDTVGVLEKYGEDLAAAAHERTGAAMIENHREALTAKRRALADTVLQNVKNTHDIVRGIERDANGKPIEGKYPPGSLNARYDEWRDSVGGRDTPIPNQSRYDAIKKAREELAGTPPDLAIFNQIIKEITREGEHIDTGAGPEAGGTEPVIRQNTALDAYKTQTTALGEKASSASGMARKALFEVYEASQKPLDQLSESKGVGDKYRQLKSDYAQYMRDWHDTGVTAGKGVNSPLARLYRAIDSEKAVSIVIDKTTGERLYKDFDRYQGYGAAANNLMVLSNADYELKSLPKPQFVPDPAKPKLPARPGTPEEVKYPTEELEKAKGKHARDVKRLEAVASRKVEKAVTSKTPDEMLNSLQEAKQDAAATGLERLARPGIHEMTMTAVGLAAVGGALAMAGGHAGYALIYLPIRFGVAAVASSPKVEEIMARVTPKDIDAINRMYERNPGMKVEGQQAVTDLLMERAKLGKSPVKLNVWQKFLSPEQMGKVLKAYMVASPKQQDKVERETIDIAPSQTSPVQVTAQQ